MIEWSFKHFDELTTTELYAILQARQAVFIIEQECVYPDIDLIDKQCMHLICIESQPAETPLATPNILAYARIIAPNVQYPEASIGRVLTTENGRNRSLGKQLLKNSIDKIKTLYPEQNIKICAQLYLLDFYQSFGFEQISEMYLEDGIPHIDMRLTF